MKINEGILKRVRVLEEKRGISYVKTGGKLYTALSVFYVLAAIFGLVMNVFYILGMLLINLGTENMKNVLAPVITVSVCSAALIAGLILKKYKKHLISFILNAISSVFLLVLFAALMEDINGFLQLKTAYYWRHLAPLVIVVITSLWVMLIAIIERKNVTSLYKKVEENLYNLYHTSANDVTEEQWEEFLNEYNGESPVELVNAFEDEKEETEE